MSASPFSLLLTPHGHLLPDAAQDAPEIPEALARRLAESFARGAGHGLLQLGAGEVGTALPPVFGYWREFAARYVTAVCTSPEQDDRGEGEPAEKNGAGAPTAPPPPAELEALAAAAPPMTGAEYLTAPVLRALWQALDAAFRAELAESGEPLPGLLQRPQ